MANQQAVTMHNLRDMLQTTLGIGAANQHALACITYLHDRFIGFTKLYCMWHCALNCITCIKDPALCVTASLHIRYLHISGTTLVAATRIIPNAIMRTKRICTSRRKLDPACRQYVSKQRLPGCQDKGLWMCVYVREEKRSLRMCGLHRAAQVLCNIAALQYRCKALQRYLTLR